MVKVKKNISSKEEYLNYRKIWNGKRIETQDEKTRREYQEMIEEMRQNVNNEINNQLKRDIDSKVSTNE